ncbi:MAG: putative photosynthetic complex assembly protein PuhE [Steroidobacteraceae bacterium]|jgi:putative photosynthetic complex assembly protein 2|nr:putative photosynthetic complex assembly protein PuhE [Steroidobacteraceae bacterium]
MSSLLIPALVALFVWWFSTGLVLLLDGLPRWTYRWTIAGATVVLAGSLWGLWVAGDMQTVAGAYLGFISGLLAWAFLEITFLTGLITGPRKHPCPPGCQGRAHFRHGVEAILYHEVAIMLAAAAVVLVSWGKPNVFGAGAFLVLWVMRQSAKLNLFLGVRNLSEDFLPDHLRYLASFFQRRPMNLLFPFSVTGATLATAWLAQRALTATSAYEATGYGLLAALMALAVLEHWMLVLPLRSEALWSFALKAQGRSPAHRDGEIGPPDARAVHGRWSVRAASARAP